LSKRKEAASWLQSVSKLRLISSPIPAAGSPLALSAATLTSDAGGLLLRKVEARAGIVRDFGIRSIKRIHRPRERGPHSLNVSVGKAIILADGQTFTIVLQINALTSSTRSSGTSKSTRFPPANNSRGSSGSR
jgi:hypothetical protein